MTKHRDVNKFRRKEKCKMAALIGQANKRVRRDKKQQQKTTTKKRIVKRIGKERKTKEQHFLKRKRRQEMSASDETKAGYT